VTIFGFDDSYNPYDEYVKEGENYGLEPPIGYGCRSNCTFCRDFRNQVRAVRAELEECGASYDSIRENLRRMREAPVFVPSTGSRIEFVPPDVTDAEAQRAFATLTRYWSRCGIRWRIDLDSGWY